MTLCFYINKFWNVLYLIFRFKNNVKIVHFIGATKPWHQPYNTSTGEVNPLPGSGHNQEFLQQWWSIFMSDVQSLLDPTLVCKAFFLYYLMHVWFVFCWYFLAQIDCFILVIFAIITQFEILLRKFCMSLNLFNII